MNKTVEHVNELVLGSPQIGLQTYEYLGGDKEARALTKARFISGELTLPVLDYPKLDRPVIEGIHSAISDLQVAVNDSELDESAQAAYGGTVDYRKREAEFLLFACDLNSETDDEQMVERAA